MKLIEKVRETTKVLKTLSRRPRRQPPQRLQARVRATTTASMDEYEDEEPQTKLTSAFVVVLILHVVAVGGIYAFNQIKASRTVTAPREKTVAAATSAAPAAAGKEANARAASDLNTANATSNQSSPAQTPPQTNTSPSTQSPIRTLPYTVKSGDTLHAIARSHSASVADVKSINNLSSDSIRPGQVLNLPLAAKVTAPAAEPAAGTAKKADPDTKPATRSYTVKSGDRLVFIAKKFNVSQEDLMALNKIKDPAKLQIGQSLKIPAKK